MSFNIDSNLFHTYLMVERACASNLATPVSHLAGFSASDLVTNISHNAGEEKMLNDSLGIPDSPQRQYGAVGARMLCCKRGRFRERREDEY